MAEEAYIQQIIPGQCPPEGCPPPTRIECIVVDKVYDSCFQIEDRSQTTIVTEFFNMVEVGDVVPCALTEGEEISCEEISKTPINDTGFFTITVLIRVPLTLTNPEDPTEQVERVFLFPKTVTLCCPEGTEIDCSESTLLFCQCVVTDVIPLDNQVPEDMQVQQVTPVTPVTPLAEVMLQCDLQLCIVLKCLSRVQLLVPSYGFCVPAPCITLPGVCPPVPPAQCF